MFLMQYFDLTFTSLDFAFIAAWQNYASTVKLSLLLALAAGKSASLSKTLLMLTITG